MPFCKIDNLTRVKYTNIFKCLNCKDIVRIFHIEKLFFSKFSKNISNELWFWVFKINKRKLLLLLLLVSLPKLTWNAEATSAYALRRTPV